MSTAGTCFAFRQPHIFLTALHCVGDAPAEELFVGIDLHNGAYFAQNVVDVRRHETADAALLFSGSHPGTTPFWDLRTNANLGEDFMAYGFPADIGSSHDIAPRLFRGHYQRFPPIWHHSHNGCRYPAVELNIACPAGLSGGPVFPADDHRVVVAMVTENIQSYTVVESFEEERRPGEKRTLESRQVINYGIALLLSGIQDWLDEHVPSHSSPPI